MHRGSPAGDSGLTASRVPRCPIPHRKPKRGPSMAWQPPHSHERIFKSPMGAFDAQLLHGKEQY